MLQLMDEGSIEARYNLSNHVGKIFDRASRAEELSPGEVQFLRFAEELIDELRFALGDAEVLRGVDPNPAILGAATSIQTVDRCLAYASEAFARLGHIYPSQELLALLRDYREQIAEVIGTGRTQNVARAEQMASFFAMYTNVIGLHHSI